MTNFVSSMKAKAHFAQRTLVLPEGTDPRMVKAAKIIMDESLAARVTLLGSVENVQETAETEGVDLSGNDILYPNADAALGDYARGYHELRKHKGLSEEQANAEITWLSLSEEMNMPMAISAAPRKTNPTIPP